MANDGPMHWRGDRTGGNDPGGNPLDEAAAFSKFNAAFSDLLGRSGPLTDSEMQAFTNFILQVTYPPNPNHNLDNSLTTEQSAGRDFFNNHTVDTLVCDNCHKLDPGSSNFGTDGFSSFENETQTFKIPHLRNLYQKVGMFGMPEVPFLLGGNNGPSGAQVRGFGFLHDGSIDTVFRFLNATVFTGFDFGPSGDMQRQQVESFALAFDSDLAPIVGQQLTLTAANGSLAAVTARLDLFDQRMDQGECDVIVKGDVGGLQRGWVRQGGAQFRSDRANEPLLTAAQLRALATMSGQELTYTAVPVGSGVRMGIDRDEDGYFDRDELDAGSDPADPLSIPAGPHPPTSTPTVTATATPTVTPMGGGCVGDCNGDGTVSVDELVKGVDIALGRLFVSACPRLQNARGMVDIAQLVASVNNALNGCGSGL
jgi:hypothetical protein